MQLWGEPTRDHVEELAAEVERSLRVPPRVEQLLLELSEVRHIDVSTCRSLARLQRKVGALGIRTAFLAARPRVKGAAWWIVHAARDPLAMPVPDLPSAEEWLSGSSERLDEVDTSPGRARKERPREE
ncbi:MAG: STAS domain-containing protein [Myxococcales bacterium]|nr:STAS domain-containing protein [Myxococcales bacterium]